MARALTADELTKLRSSQASLLWLDADVPPVIFSCRVNQTFSTKDRVIEVTYDSVTFGAYGDMLAGMTCLVGSAAGLEDVGQCRIRKAATSTKLFLGENADIAWADDLYLTVIDEFGIWDKQMRDGGADYEIAYSDQHEDFSPIVNAGPARRVAKLTGAYVDLQYDWSGSWVLGSTISTYSVSAPGSVSITGGSTATPTIRYDTAGRYRIAVTITAANGKSTTVYRTVRIWSDAAPLISGFVLTENPRGSYWQGGWEFAMTVYGDEADIASIRDRTMITLIAQDFYDGVEGGIGAVTGYENIVALGWVDGLTIDRDPHKGTVTFSVRGPHFFLDRLQGSAVQLINTWGTPASWTEMNSLTVDQAIYHLVYWRSTVAAVMDVYKSGDTRIAPELSFADASLWAKLLSFSDKILGRPCCDRYGRLFVEIDPQLTTPGSRSGPTVIPLISSDWGETGLSILQRVISDASWLALASWFTDYGSATLTYYSLSPGHDRKRFGQPGDVKDQVLAGTQAQSNEMAGLIMGNRNRKLDFEFKMAMNNRAVDICPAQYVSLVMAAGDSYRGISYSGKIVVREIEESHEKRGFLLSNWRGEQESFAENSANGDIPNVAGDGFDDLPELPPLPGLPKLPTLSIIPGVEPNSKPRIVILATTNFGVLYTETFHQTLPQWKMMNGGLSSGQYMDIWDIAVAPSGAIAVMFGRTDNHCRYIAVSPGIGQPFEIVFDAETDIVTVNPDRGIIAMGVNQGINEQFGIVWAGMTNPILGNGLLLFIDRNGFTPKVANDEFSLAHFGGLSFGYDKWLLTHAKVDIFGTAEITRMNAAGTSVEYQANTGGSNASDQTHRRMGMADRLLMYSVLGPGHIITNQGQSVGTLSGFTLTKERNRISVAGSPSGLSLMGGDGASITPKRSSDGGASWGVVGTLSTGRNVWECCRSDNIFIAGAGDIQLTMDWGDTWENKQGNLLTLAPLVNITHIEFLSF